jgi:hypothetical protein
VFLIGKALLAMKRIRPAIAGLGAAALVAWFARPVPPRGLFTPNRAISSSLLYLIAVTAACAVGVLVASRKNRRGRESSIRRLTAIAIWFAPAAIFLASRRTFAVYLGSLSTLEVIAVLLISAGLWWLDRPESPPDLAYSGGMFALPHTTRLMRQLPLSIGLALLAEFIAALVVSEEVFVAILLACAAAALFWRARNSIRPVRKLRALTTTLAVMLTVAGIFHFVGLPLHSGDARKGTSGGSDPNTNPPYTEAGAGNGLDGWAGVILIPEVKKHVTIVPAINADVLRKQDAKPLTIPFYGVYWFYRFPATGVPANAVTMRGTPEDIRFRSQGRTPLKMEAHQNLGKLIDLSCCSRIQVAIHNSEHSPEPNRLQLILADSSGKGQPAESLGMQPVDGSEDQVLDFPIHANFQLRSFDEFTVRFFRGWVQSQLSARISVERFVLVPRGR